MPAARITSVKGFCLSHFDSMRPHLPLPALQTNLFPLVVMDGRYPVEKYKSCFKEEECRDIVM